MGEAGTSQEGSDTPKWQPPEWMRPAHAPLDLRPPLEGEERLAFEAWLRDSYLLGEHPSIVELRGAIIEAGAASHPVLVIGESGTGKELTAHGIHLASRRRHRKPEVPILANSGDRAGSDLFGHRKGAFTGAIEDHRGHLASAHCAPSRNLRVS